MDSNMITKTSFTLIDKHQHEYICYLGCCDFNGMEELEQKLGLLTNDEKKYYGTLKALPRQKSYLLGRGCAKEIIGDILGYRAQEVSIENGIFGQPFIALPQKGISITHTEWKGACIIFPQQLLMGIDLESILVSKQKTLYSVTVKEERDEMIKVVGDEMKALTILWTLKEALGKAICTGITIPYEWMEVNHVVLNKNEGCIQAEFKNFPQYQARSWIIDQSAMSIVFPMNTEWKGLLNL